MRAILSKEPETHLKTKRTKSPKIFSRNHEGSEQNPSKPTFAFKSVSQVSQIFWPIMILNLQMIASLTTYQVTTNILNVWKIKQPEADFSNSLIYSCCQKLLNDDHLGQVNESWYLMKHQIKHHQVFIWDETCFSFEIKHLHFNEMFSWLVQLMETMQQQYQRKHINT